jgi:hypothetical protein
MTGDGEVRWSATLSDTRARAAISARRHGVPGTMIESAARRRAAGDWRGACDAADADVCLNPDAIRRRHGAEPADALLADLRNLAPDLLRWHLPRCGHGDGLLRGNLLVPLADYAERPDSHRRLILAAATPSAALAAGQRIVLTVVKSDVPNPVLHGVHRGSAHRYSLLRHRMFWDARHAPALRELINVADVPALQRSTRLQDAGQVADAWAAAGIELVERPPGQARDEEHRRLTRWLATVPVNLPSLVQRVRTALPGADEVVIRAGGGGVIVLRGLEGSPRSASGSVTAEAGPTVAGRHLPVLPEAVWLRPVDADLVRFGLLRPQELHPLVAPAVLQNTDELADPGRTPGSTGPCPASRRPARTGRADRRCWCPAARPDTASSISTAVGSRSTTTTGPPANGCWRASAASRTRAGRRRAISMPERM